MNAEHNDNIIIRFLPDPNHHPSWQCRHATALLLLVVIIYLIYSNSFNCDWHFDDYSNILQNDRVHIQTINFKSITHTAFAGPASDRLYRPLPMISFALNWYIGKDHVWGYHLVNIFIHITTAGLLFFTSKLLMDTPVGKKQNFTNPYFIALLTATIWAIHPIQVQSVTYIVQRMAAMASMFYLLSLFCYLKLRLTQSKRVRICYALGCSVSFIAGILSKENAIMLPFSIILVELIFFDEIKKKILLKEIVNRKNILIAAIVISLLALMVGVIFLDQPTLQVIKNSYNHRPFTLMERLFTEPRVLILYLSLLLYPAQGRFSIGHIIPVSKSIVDPWTTLLCVALIILLVGFSVFQLRRRPFLSFGILFFFLNHLVESSFIGLELVFEHRNYLPSLFLFVPLSILIYKSINFFYQTKRAYYFIISLGTIFLIFILGMTTFTRNYDWRSVKTLWENVLVQYPGSTRAMHNLAYGYYSKNGMYSMALKLYSKALSMDWSHSSKTYRKSKMLSNVAGIYYLRGMNQKAISFWDLAIEADPENINAMHFKARAQISLGQYDSALETLIHIPTERPALKILILKTLILYKQGNYHEAIEACRKALKIDPTNIDGIFYMASLYSKLGQYNKSNYFLKTAQPIHRNDIRILIQLLDNAIIMKNSRDSDNYIELITKSVKCRDVWSTLKQSKRKEKIPFNLYAIVPLLIEKSRQDTGIRVQLLEQLIAEPPS